LTYAVLLQSAYGPFLVNRNDQHQPEALLRTGLPHIDPEIRAILQLVDYLGADPVALDCGANVGLIAVPLAQRLAGCGGIVHAFEPQRTTYYMLAGNTAMSGLLNLGCHRLALGEVPGEIELPILDPYRPADFGMVSLGHQTDLPSETVPLASVDSLGFHRVDLIKIDVERMELALLKGAAETIARCRPLIWIEIWPDQYGTVTPWLEAAGYSLFVFDALNFLAIPRDRLETIPVTLEPFDGRHNPHFG